MSLSALLLLPPRLAGQTGELRVGIDGSGASLDTDGYVVALDEFRRSLDAESTAVFTGLKPGIYTVVLLDVAGECSVTGGNSQNVVVKTGSVAELLFEVVCGLQAPTSSTRLPPETVARDAPKPSGSEPTEPPRPPADSADFAMPLPSISETDHFSAGRWVATIEPAGSSSYPVYMTLFSDRSVGEDVGSASYEADTWTCSFDLILESMGDDRLVVIQRLTDGYCPDGIRLSLTRQTSNMAAEWLHPDGSPWFDAIFVRSP